MCHLFLGFTGQSLLSVDVLGMDSLGSIAGTMGSNFAFVKIRGNNNN